MSADSETASYTSATVLSDNDRQPCPVRRRLHDRRSADDRFGRLRSPVTNSSCVKSQRAEASTAASGRFGWRKRSVVRLTSATDASASPLSSTQSGRRFPAASLPSAEYFEPDFD
jgi:hypothetical protein